MGWWWGLLVWEIGRRLGHYGDHPRPQVADRWMPSRVDKRAAPDREGAADKQCQGEGKLWSQYVITNREEGKGKPPRLFPKTGYPLWYPEPALQQKTEERERENGMMSHMDKQWAADKVNTQTLIDLSETVNRHHKQTLPLPAHQWQQFSGGAASKNCGGSVSMGAGTDKGAWWRHTAERVTLTPQRCPRLADPVNYYHLRHFR